MDFKTLASQDTLTTVTTALKSHHFNSTIVDTKAEALER